MHLFICKHMNNKQKKNGKLSNMITQTFSYINKSLKQIYKNEFRLNKYKK